MRGVWTRGGGGRENVQGNGLRHILEREEKEVGGREVRAIAKERVGGGAEGKRGQRQPVGGGCVAEVGRMGPKLVRMEETQVGS